MSDITKCTGTNCPLRFDCWRFLATTNEFRQTFFREVPIDENGKCEYYWYKTK